jgi:DNA-binding HxlR family transcriptional regulator
VGGPLLRTAYGRPVDDDPLAATLDVLARRGALDAFRALESGAVTERGLATRLKTYAPSVVAQRVADLRRIGAVEVVPETGDLRLSPHGRRLQGLLDQLGRWAEQG